MEFQVKANVWSKGLGGRGLGVQIRCTLEGVKEGWGTMGNGMGVTMRKKEDLREWKRNETGSATGGNREETGLEGRKRGEVTERERGDVGILKGVTGGGCLSAGGQKGS